MSNVKIDRETFLVYLSVYVSAFDNLAQKFEEIYQTDVERFYLKAIRSKGYRHEILNDSSILDNYKQKRIYGVLLAAEEDDTLRNNIEAILYRFDKSFEQFVKKPTMKAMQTLQLNYRKYSDNDATSAATYFPVYLAINKYGTDADIGEFQFVLNLISEVTDLREMNRNNSFQKAIREMPNPFTIVEIDDKAWKICRRLKDGHDLFRAVLPLEHILTDSDNQYEGGEIYSELLRYMERGDKEKKDFHQMSIMLSSFANIAQYFGFSPTAFLRGINLNKEEQQMIAKTLAFPFYNSILYRENTGKIFCSIALTEYFVATAFFVLLKSIKQTKQYFEDNNNETIFSQIQYYREEKERQDDELKKLRKELQEEREKSDLLRKQIQTQGVGATTDTKPFMEEISVLNRKLKELQEELGAEREKTDELNRLREFVFSIKSEYIPESDETDLKGLIKDKKIVIIGGHILWRNKLKDKYPSIITMDGHNATSDFSSLSNADLVLLNTSNMSHTVYYKVIEILRGGTTKFDYIGRSTNQELYEKEMADIIKKHS